MANFDASINLDVKSTAAERQVKKLERSISKVEDASRSILGVDQEILQVRRNLLTLSGQQEVKARKRLADLRLQKAELTLQKRELQQIAKLDKDQARRANSGGSDGGGSIPLAASVSRSSPVLALGLQQSRQRQREIKRISDVYNQGEAAIGRSQKGINAGLEQRKAITEEILGLQQKLTDEIAESQDLNKKLNSIDNSKDPNKTARLLLPDKTRLSNKGLAELDKVNARIKEQNIGLEEAQRLRKSVYERFTLSAPQQIKKATASQEQLERSIVDTGQKIQDQRRAYEEVSKEVRQLDGQERRRALTVQNTLDQIDQRRKKSAERQARRQKRIQGVRTGAAAGLATANIPGQSIVQATVAGAVIGGGAGAATGAIVGLTAALGQYGSQIAVSSAETRKFEIALKGVTGSNSQQALERLNEINDRFNSTTRNTIQGFTQLLAAGNSANIPLEQQLKTYEGLVVASKALGGSQDDLNGILRATTQVFSKNKVQAEELRGQIGDRLPGAVGQFAKALGITTAELDQRLKDGQVSVQDFVKFATSFLGPNSEYEKAAKNIADAPEDAGAKLTRSLEGLERTLGPVFGRLGAQFQEFAAQAITELEKVAKFLLRTGADIESKLGGIGNLDALIKNREFANEALTKALKAQAETPTSAIKEQERLQKIININLKAIKDIDKQIEKFKFGPEQPAAPVVPPAATDTETNKPDPDAESAAERAAERLSNARRITKEKAAQLEIDRRLEEAILRQDRAEQAILQGERDILLVRQKLAFESAAAASEAEKQQLFKAAGLDVDRISIRVQRELAEISRDKTTELKEQRELLLQIAGIERTATGAKPIEDPTRDLRDELRGLQNQRKFGGDADLAAKVEDLVLNKGVPFNEAFDIAEQVKAQRELNAETERYNQLIQSVANTIETGIVDAITVGIDALVRGTEDLDTALKDIAAGVLQDISRQLLSAAVRLGLSSLGGNDGVGVFSRLFPQREEGGPVSSGVSYLVGEKGPELFTPDRNGQIIDNDAFTAAASALRSSDSITPSEGEDASEAFAQAAAALVRNTTTITNNSQTSNQALMAESMQASMAASKEPIRLQTTVINSVEYATVEQVGEAMKQTKKQAEAEVFTKLKNRPSVRRSVGM